MVLLSPSFRVKVALPFSNRTPYRSSFTVSMVSSSSVSTKVNSASQSSTSCSPVVCLWTIRLPVGPWAALRDRGVV